MQVNTSCMRWPTIAFLVLPVKPGGPLWSVPKLNRQRMGLLRRRWHLRIIQLILIKAWRKMEGNVSHYQPSPGLWSGVRLFQFGPWGLDCIERNDKIVTGLLNIFNSQLIENMLIKLDYLSTQLLLYTMLDKDRESLRGEKWSHTNIGTASTIDTLHCPCLSPCFWLWLRFSVSIKINLQQLACVLALTPTYEPQCSLKVWPFHNASWMYPSQE